MCLHFADHINKHITSRLHSNQQLILPSINIAIFSPPPFQTELHNKLQWCKLFRFVQRKQ